MFSILTAIREMATDLLGGDVKPIKELKCLLG
jgi:hypothetical protein